MAENEITAETGQEAQQPAPEIIVKTTESGGTAEVVHTDPAAETEAPQEVTPEAKSEEDSKSLEADIEKQQKTEVDLKNDLDSKGVNFDDLAKEYDKNGELSADSLAALEKAGYPQSVVDAYLNGLQATADRFVSNVKAMAGGDTGYKELTEYIKTQPQGTIDAFNAAIQTGNMGQIQLAIAGLKAQMTTKFGTANRTIMAGQAGAGTPAGYTSSAQMTKDMSDPRYQNDPVFTKEVMRKIQYATFF